MSYQHVWDESALEVTKRIIHSQDVLITGLGACLQGVKAKDYNAFNKDFGAIPFIASLMKKQCDALLYLRKGKRGTKPLWFEWGEHVKYFCLNIERAWPMIRKEARREDWAYWQIIQGRLEECQQQCLEFQIGSERYEEGILKMGILAILPKEGSNHQIHVSQEAAIEWIELAKTLQMGDVTLGSDGFYYRRKY